MEADGHAELLDGTPQRLHLGIVNVAAVNRVRVADHGHGAALANRAPGLGDRAGNVAEGDLGGELQPRRVVLAVVVGPLVVGARQRGRHLRIEVVVHLHLTPARSVEHGDVDALDVHGLHVRLWIVASRVRRLVVRMPRERAVLQILTNDCGAIALGHLAELEVADLDDGLRSEERRVGKEGRSWSWAGAWTRRW